LEEGPGIFPRDPDTSRGEGQPVRLISSLILTTIVLGTPLALSGCASGKKKTLDPLARKKGPSLETPPVLSSSATFEGPWEADSFDLSIFLSVGDDLKKTLDPADLRRAEAIAGEPRPSASYELSPEEIMREPFDAGASGVWYELVSAIQGHGFSLGPSWCEMIGPIPVRVERAPSGSSSEMRAEMMRPCDEARPPFDHCAYINIAKDSFSDGRPRGKFLVLRGIGFLLGFSTGDTKDGLLVMSYKVPKLVTDEDYSRSLRAMASRCAGIWPESP
jgi:hypothetical protein